MADREARLLALEASIVRAIRGKGYAVYLMRRDPYRPRNLGLFSPSRKFVEYAEFVNTAHRVQVLLHEAVHLMEYESGAIREHDSHGLKEARTEAAAAHALFQLFGYDGYCRIYAGVYADCWMQSAEGWSDWRDFTKLRRHPIGYVSDDRSEAMAGEVIEFLGLTEVAP